MRVNVVAVCVLVLLCVVTVRAQRDDGLRTRLPMNRQQVCTQAQSNIDFREVLHLTQALL